MLVRDLMLFFLLAASLPGSAMAADGAKASSSPLTGFGLAYHYVARS